MNKYWKDKWISALRSGKYEQGYGQLCTDDKNYCCLGVLAEVISKEQPSLVRREVSVDGTVVTYNDEDICLTEDIQKLTGINGECATLPTPIKTYPHLASLNDSGAYSFKQIADIIEEQL